MDTSETFVKMANCPEIQERWRDYWHDWGKPQDGDFYVPTVEDGYELDVRVVNYEFPWPARDDKGLIWLPRQDQIQDMLCYKDVAYLLDAFDKWYHENLKLRTDFWWEKEGTKSMDQLWLAFFMHDRYNKTWNGEKWI